MAGFTHSTTKLHVYGCSVPRLTRFTGSVCMGPGRKKLLTVDLSSIIENISDLMPL
jgi:hypothetical protein